MAQQASTREATTAWLQKFHRVMDSLSTSRLHEVYAKDAILKFGNNEEVKGLESIVTFFAQQFANLDSMKHTIVHFEAVGDTIYQAADIAYVAKGDPQQLAVTITGFAVFFRVPDGKGEDEAGKVMRFEVYLDPTPLVERMKQVAAERI